MQRGQTSSSQEAGKTPGHHTFSIKRISIESSCPSIEVDFSPILTYTSSPLVSTPEQHQRRCIPTFNQDSSYFTPAFILEIDREKYISHAQSYLSLHQAKVVQLCTEKTELLVPRPSKMSHFCCICKAIFQDYLTHVNIPMHQQLLRNSVFNTSITQLCQLYKKEQVEVTKRGRKTSKKIIKADDIKKKLRKNSDSLLNSIVVKLDCSEQAKTRGFAD